MKDIFVIGISNKKNLFHPIEDFVKRKTIIYEYIPYINTFWALGTKT